MKKAIAFIVFSLILSTGFLHAQSGSYTPIAGGSLCLPPDHGPAIPGCVFAPQYTMLDRNGTLYVAANHVIFKIDTTGTITRLIGDGTTPWDSVDYEDGNPALNGHVFMVSGMATDSHGNFYFADNDLGRLRKIDTYGIVTSLTYYSYPFSVCVDSLDNVYYCGTDSKITKITPSGASLVIAGTGTDGFGGDGGLATLAQLSYPSGLVIGRDNYLYFTDNNRIRKISPDGYISTFAGNGSVIPSGDGGFANEAGIGSTFAASLHFDPAGNLYYTTDNYMGSTPGPIHRKITPAGTISTPAFLSDQEDAAIDHNGNFYVFHDGYIAKFRPAPDFSSGSFTLNVNYTTAGPISQIHSDTYTSGLHVTTFFGDGAIDLTTFTPATYGTGGNVSITHHYTLAGTYTIRHIIYNAAGAAIDSFSYSYQHRNTGTIHIVSYADQNSNCSYDGGDNLIFAPLTVSIDSNGVPVDTISFTGGLYYTAYGTTGDIYSVHLLHAPAGIALSCGGSSLNDTFTIYNDNSREMPMGFYCTTGTAFDLYVNSIRQTGRHTQTLNIQANNATCATSGAVVTLNFSPKYEFFSATPAPTGIAGHTATWNTALILPTATPININVTLERTGTWLMPGDTVHTTIRVSPTSGDSDTTNNMQLIIDTVRSSFDPNHIQVSPEGNILNRTKLKYAIEFENDGNDTAQNIYVLDTLSDHLDPSTFEMVASSNYMDIQMLENGGHTILKFDFPNIKLPDSTHHNQCTGMLIFNIKTKGGLPDGSRIINRAGIYFDDNEVVMTNESSNTIRLPYVSITQTDTVCHGDTTTFRAQDALIANSHYRWSINSIPAGPDMPVFHTTGLSAGDIIKCNIWDGTGDSLLASSSAILPVFLSLPDAGTITGTNSVCAGSNTTLSNTATGGTWSSSSANATVTGGVVAGITAGSAIISYTATNICGAMSDTMLVTINPLPDAGTITGPTSVCTGTNITLSNSATGGTWLSSTGAADIADGVVTGISAGNVVIFYSVTNICGNASDTMAITINTVPNAGTITGSTAICAGTTTSLSAGSAGGTWSSSATAIATVNTSGTVSATAAGAATITYLISNTCGADTATMNINVITLPDPGSISGTDTVCQNATVALSASVASGTWSSSNTTLASVSSSGIVTGISSGTATISYQVSNTCGSNTTTYTITVLPVAACPDNVTNITRTTALTLYPNPNDGTFTIAGSWNSSETQVRIELLNVLGQVVYSETAPIDNGSISIVMQTGNKLSAGNYLVRISDGTNQQTLRLTSTN